MKGLWGVIRGVESATPRREVDPRRGRTAGGDVACGPAVTCSRTLPRRAVPALSSVFMAPPSLRSFYGIHLPLHLHGVGPRASPEKFRLHHFPESLAPLFLQLLFILSRFRLISASDSFSADMDPKQGLFLSFVNLPVCCFIPNSNRLSSMSTVVFSAHVPLKFCIVKRKKGKKGKKKGKKLPVCVMNGFLSPRPGCFDELLVV